MVFVSVRFTFKTSDQRKRKESLDVFSLFFNRNEPYIQKQYYRILLGFKCLHVDYLLFQRAPRTEDRYAINVGQTKLDKRKLQAPPVLLLAPASPNVIQARNGCIKPSISRRNSKANLMFATLE